MFKLEHEINTQFVHINKSSHKTETTILHTSEASGDGTSVISVRW